MAHSQHRKKRIRVNEERRILNKGKRSAMRTHMKKVFAAVEAGDKATATAELRIAHKRIDKAAKTRVIHPNNAARKKSLLSRHVAKLLAS